MRRRIGGHEPRRIAVGISKGRIVVPAATVTCPPATPLMVLPVLPMLRQDQQWRFRPDHQGRSDGGGKRMRRGNRIAARKAEPNR